MNTEEINKHPDLLKRSSFLNIAGILLFITSLIYASYTLYDTEKQIKIKDYQVKSLDSIQKNLILRIDSLKQDEGKLTDFLLQLLESTEKSNKYQYNDVINWTKIRQTIIDLPSGKRKTAILIAILTTWKEIPFKLGANSTIIGFDSPGFLNYVISQVGISVEKDPNEYLSVALMKKFKRVDKPLPGDIIFYKGQIGYFGLIYLCNGDDQSQGIAIGTLQARFPLSIYATTYINTKYFPFHGYYHVNYEDFE